MEAPGSKQQDNATVPKLVTAYAVAEQFDLIKVVEILRNKGFEPDPLNTGLSQQVIHVQVPISFHISGGEPCRPRSNGHRGRGYIRLPFRNASYMSTP